MANRDRHIGDTCRLCRGLNVITGNLSRLLIIRPVIDNQGHALFFSSSNIGQRNLRTNQHVIGEGTEHIIILIKGRSILRIF